MSTICKVSFSQKYEGLLLSKLEGVNKINAVVDWWIKAKPVFSTFFSVSTDIVRRWWPSCEY